MKNIVLILSFILCSFYCAFAQGFIVSYEETISIRMPSSTFDHVDNPQVRAALESRTGNRNMEQSKSAKLIVNAGVSVYKTETSEQPNREKKPERVADGNMNMTGNISMGINMSAASPTVIYKNHLDGMMLSQLTLEGKEYLIEEPLSETSWKVGKKKRNISDYECIEATAKTSNGMSITAWYTPDIPISDGPSSYRGLPGLILFLDYNDGMRTFSCTSIEQDSNSLPIEAPNTGEKVTREQYNKVIAEVTGQRTKDGITTTTDRRGNTTTTTTSGTRVITR